MIHTILQYSTGYIKVQSVDPVFAVTRVTIMKTLTTLGLLNHDIQIIIGKEVCTAIYKIYCTSIHYMTIVS